MAAPYQHFAVLLLFLPTLVSAPLKSTAIELAEENTESALGILRTTKDQHDLFSSHFHNGHLQATLFSATILKIMPVLHAWNIYKETIRETNNGLIFYGAILKNVYR